MGIIAFIILGLLAGLIAKAIMPGSDPLDEFFDISTWLTAIIGSIVLLALYRVIVDRGGDRALRA
jgi:uncharacterized membrane protein YeaQ/YmgE (transglycosylase-associated protein family)